jgi:hypothetical protein
MEAKESSAIMKFEQERNAVADVLNKKEPLTPADIRLLRENVDGAVFAGRLDVLTLRMTVELIDTIRALNTATTRLMWVAIGVAVVGVIVSAAQIIAAVLLRR